MGKKGAIENDASATEQGADDQQQAQDGGKERPLSPREEAMKSITTRRTKELAAEASGKALNGSEDGEEEVDDGYQAPDPTLNAEGQEATDSGEQEAEDSQEQQETAAEPAAAAGENVKTGSTVNGSPVYERDGKQYVKVKINGQEVEATLEQALRRAQINWAADVRLEAVSAKERTIEQRERAIKDKELALSNKMSQSSTTSSGATPDADLDSEVNELVHGLFQGDEKQAKDTLKKVLARRTTATAQPVNEDAIVEKAVGTLRRESQQQAEARQRQQLLAAIDTFQAEHPDIAADPVLAAAWDAETARLSKTNPDKSLVDIAREAGKNIQTRLVKAATPNQSRVDKKREAGVAAKGNQRSASTGQDAPPPKTREQVIANMRKARGQVI